MSSSPGLYYNNKDTNYSIALNDPRKLMGKFRRMDDVFNQLILRTFQRGRGGLHRLTERHLDSILEFELQAKGISLPFEYSVVDKGEKVLVSESWRGRSCRCIRRLYFPMIFLARASYW
ncbi:MAG: hypothetical protein U5L96_13225 [Owenweeksia sp.]|nr:hypothetical protein [Owenweeksia sp.]